MTVREFCLKKTQNGELCVFRIYEQIIIGSTWIDNEDLFTINHIIRDKKVKYDEWGTLEITTEHGDKIQVPCHYIDF